ncbi:hypothetical protein [Streptosporangium carneum]|uniref:Uncharacterized protein n=1 Tax=Streptosporangium carneum TaxID=47481 RepID=A0A9W6MD27_9ACTN|nr:hypothetical protein [Streptosporangium carneum]GLK09475.1 hypothetical protein GCM10017600_28810 [Streptosporangium carneum]
MRTAILRLSEALRQRKTRWATRSLTGPSLEHLYDRYGREILAKAAAEPALSQAIAQEVDMLEMGLPRGEGAPTPAQLRAFLVGYGQAMVDTAVIRPDLVAVAMGHNGYPPTVVGLGALCQKAFAAGLLRMEPAPARQ